MSDPEIAHSREGGGVRAPRTDETLVARPALPDAPGLVRDNRAAFEKMELDLQGRSLATLRAAARSAAVEAARSYTSELTGEALPERPCESLIAAGHQPSLFHPGVWVKNFALSELAQRSGGVSLNLVVDNDTFSNANTHVRVPRGPAAAPVVETVAFETERPVQPWEDAAILDRGTFATFGGRLREAMADWGVEPLGAEVWPDAVEHAKCSPRLRDCLTAMRHRQERRWGVDNLELPISRLCELEPFLWFAAHILAQLPDFHAVYNEALREYRTVNTVRSLTRPVPDLKRWEEWLEAPFWVWREGDLRRRRVYARQLGQEVELSDGMETFARLPLSPDADACCAVDVLRQLPGRGLRLRTRALTTTLFSRLCLCDLFVHGIGGAKYDEITDRIITDFCGLTPPGFLTLSATLHLPLAEPFNVTPSDETRLRVLLRDLGHNPDRHLTPGLNREVDQLVGEKRELIAEQHAYERADGPRRKRRTWRRRNYQRFCRFHEIDERLAAHCADQRQRAENELQTVRRQLAANDVLQDREYSFCLYPADKLERFLTTLWER